MSEEILFEQINQWGVITLNRPKTLNALTHAMVKAMRAQLQIWEQDTTIAAVMIKGEGERAFCAGGDIRWLHDIAKEDVIAACEFFRDEYTNNAAIFHFSKPYVALIDGIVMGGGVGVSVHGDFRIAGDNTLFAMPETGIGLFPDVGGGYFMPRLPESFGLYYALTGARAKAGDCMAAGIATHYVPTDRQAAMREGLQELSFAGDDDHGTIAACLADYAGSASEISMETKRADMNRLFSGAGSVVALMETLASDPSDFAAATHKTLATMSPRSLKLTFEQMRRGKNLDFNALMKMEFRMVNRVMQQPDFFEGVRALIIDKDKSPKWSPDHLAGVSDDEIAGYFEPLGARELAL